MPQERPPSTPDYQSFKEKVSSLKPELADQVEQAIKNSPLNEGVALEKIAQDDDKAVNQWYDTFFQDLKEATKENLAGVNKLQKLNDRITHVIENKLEELGNKYGKPTDSEKKPAETKNLQTLYENVRHYMSIFSSLGVDKDSAALKQMERLCTENKNPTPEELRQIGNFQISTIVISSTQSLMTLLDHLSKSEFETIGNLAKDKKQQLQGLVIRFMQNPLASDQLQIEVDELLKDTLIIQTECKKLLQEQLKTQKEDQAKNKISQVPILETIKKFGEYETMKQFADYAATVFIPYYSTISQLIPIYKTMFATGRVDEAALAKLNQTWALDTAFLLPVLRVGGAAGKEATMALSKGAGKVIGPGAADALKAVAGGAENLGKTATEIGVKTPSIAKKIPVIGKKIGEKIPLYTPLNVAGTARLMYLTDKELVEKVVDLRSKKDWKQFLLIGVDLGYLIFEAATYKYTINKNLPLSPVRKIFEETLENFKEVQVKQNPHLGK